MEPAEVSSVPYSLSDIHLPESSGKPMKPVSKSVLEEASTDQQIAKGSTTQSESHANGSSSSNEKSLEKQSSEPASTVNGESPQKEKAPSLKSIDTEENHLKDEEARRVHKKTDLKDKKEESEGSEEGEMKSDSESSSEESSDSNERRRRRRKSQKVKRKKDRKADRSHSSSSGSRSRESSLEKKDSKSHQFRQAGGVKEEPKQRLKLKRDNVSESFCVKDSSVISEKDDSSNRKNSDVKEPEHSKPPAPQPVKYVSTRKIRLSSSKLKDKAEDEPKSKRGKWGNFSTSQKTSQCISISTDSLKNWFPDFKLLKAPESVCEVDDTLPPVKESNPVPHVERMDESTVVREEPKVREPEADRVDDGMASNILFIQNLVRPFTLLQLKELLKETGTFIEEKFWIDKIKSKCFVVYGTEEEAVKTRNVLNGSRWPSSNPKILSVEFSNEEDLQFHQSGSEAPKDLLPPPPIEKLDSRDDRTFQSTADSRKKEREPDHRRERTKLPVREWDKNKLTQESPTRERTSRSAERYKASDKREKKEAKRRPNEDTPAKLLDDLFQKTKSSPCIYWLPLTEEQVVERKESQRLRKAEREKRLQQREQEDTEHKSKNVQSRNRTRETETRRSSTRSRSPRRR